MKHNQPIGWTTISQSKQLLEAGLDKNTADMRYEASNYECLGEWIPYPIPFGGHVTGFNILEKFFPSETFYPCWSLGKLIDLLSKDDAIQRELSVGTYRISDGIDENDFYVDVESAGNYKPFINKDLVQAVVDAVIYCLEQSYIKKGETK